MNEESFIESTGMEYRRGGQYAFPFAEQSAEAIEQGRFAVSIP